MKMDGDFVQQRNGIENVAQEKDLERTGNHTELAYDDSAGNSNRDFNQVLLRERSKESAYRQSAKFK